MAKLIIVSLVCLIVTASSLTSCFAARGLRDSLPADQISPSETNTRTANLVYETDSTQSSISPTMTESYEEVSNTDWEELSQEELVECMDGTDIGPGESSRELEVDRPCRRMLQPDYGPPSSNKNKKGGGNYGGDYGGDYGGKNGGKNGGKYKHYSNNRND